MTDVSKAAKASGSILLIGFLGLYLTDFITGYGFASVHPVVLLPLMGTALFAAAGFWLQKYKKAYTALCFIVLFLLYSCRVWPDNVTSYLWCEDGIEMISDAIFKGASSLFDASNLYRVSSRLFVTVSAFCSAISRTCRSFRRLLPRCSRQAVLCILCQTGLSGS